MDCNTFYNTFVSKSTNSTCSDAMALVRVYGKPDFFITFNVDCREGKAEIELAKTFDVWVDG